MSLLIPFDPADAGAIRRIQQAHRAKLEALAGLGGYVTPENATRCDDLDRELARCHEEVRTRFALRRQAQYPSGEPQ